MLAVAHDSRLNAVEKDGVSRRARLEASAAKGNPTAIAALDGPESPECVAYLLDWAGELVGASGEGMNGLAPLSWPAIDAWAIRTRRNPTHAECMALRMLDRVILHPGDAAPSSVSEEVIDSPAARDAAIAWPSKKQEG